MSRRSFRLRVVLGVALGISGLLALAHVVVMRFAVSYPVIFHISHTTILITGLLALALGVLQLRRGLSPFQVLRARLNAVRDGSARRIDGSYPEEVQPLVNDLNSLLDQREATVERALAKAGDLAHGLKTPLAVLAQEADRAEAAGHAELAATIGQQVERMRRQVDYHLVRARAAATGATPGVHCSVAASAGALARTLQRLHAERGTAIELEVPAGHEVRGRREDLDEMLGNLLDNACKWARSRVVVRSAISGEDVLIDVEDDGPGIAPELRETVLQRGVRADEAAPGSGFGLAIVRDLAELYRGAITLASSPLGGLRARLRLPR